MPRRPGKQLRLRMETGNETIINLIYYLSLSISVQAAPELGSGAAPAGTAGLDGSAITVVNEEGEQTKEAVELVEGNE